MEKAITKRIKILHVFGSTFYGGAEKRTIEAMHHFDKSLYCFDVCSLIETTGTLDTHIMNMGCKIFYLSKKNPRFAKRFLSILQTEKYDIVHTHVYPFSGYILYLSKKAGIRKRIMHFRSSYEQHENIIRKCFRSIMNRLIDKYATDILAVCQGAMDITWGIYKDHRCHVIYNGIDLNLTEDITVDVKTLLSVTRKDSLITHVGSMTPVKNHKMIVEIFYEIQKIKPNSTLLLIGRKNAYIEKKLLERCRELSIEKKVIIAGVYDNVFPFLKASDLFLFPSFFEGLPGAVLEACAVNLPVLASNIPGVKEIANYCSNVYCLSLQRSPQEWARKSLQVMQKQHNILLEETPFCIEKNIKALRKVYERELF